MRFPQPHDPDGRPCLPTHHPQSQRPWPTSPMPTRSTSRTRSPPPAGPPGHRLRPASCPWPPLPLIAILAMAASAVLAGARSLAAIAEWAAEAPSRCGPRWGPPRRPRPVRRPGRGHHRPHPGSPGRRRLGRRGRRLAGRPGPAAGASQTRRQPATGGRRRRQDPARRPHPDSRWRRPSGAPAGGDGPHQPRGAGPMPARRRPEEVPRSSRCWTSSTWPGR
jgi:hypothetical protein